MKLRREREEEKSREGKAWKRYFGLCPPQLARYLACHHLRILSGLDAARFVSHDTKVDDFIDEEDTHSPGPYGRCQASLEATISWLAEG